MRLSTLLLSGALVAGAALPAQAAIYTTTFSGTVTSQSGMIASVGSTVTGSFNYSSDANSLLSFTIGGFTATPPYTSIATVTPTGISNPYEVLVQALTSAAQNNGPTNTSFALDLLALNNFNSTSATAILNTPNLGSLLETQGNSFDGNYSSFSYSAGTSTGTTRSIVAALDPNSLSTTVPEPASLMLLAAPLIGLVARRRR